MDMENDECKHLGYDLKNMLNVVTKIVIYWLS